MATSTGKKILAVDDERHIVRLVQVNLERAGYQVVTAFDGKEALEKVESEQPDMVVLDVMMPYMDGFEVLQQLRKNPMTRDLPVIMLTAKAQDADVFRGWQMNCDCYLTKPFNPMELISFVRRIFKAQEDGDGDGPILDLG
ncbi:MAG TPA: response regulator [Chthonomonadales bacterium]|nr:response regulator [Chthonomonadales bacterium]